VTWLKPMDPKSCRVIGAMAGQLDEIGMTRENQEIGAGSWV